MKKILFLLIVILPLTLLAQEFLHPDLVEPYEFDTTYSQVDFATQLSLTKFQINYILALLS